MDEKRLFDAVKELRTSEKKNFKQTVDLIVNLKGLDLKNPDHQVEFFVELPKAKGKKTKVCAFIGPELGDSAKANMDTAVLQQDFDKFDKKASKKLAMAHDFFIAQATIMPKVAAAFGRVLGPKGKMPNPKAGCVVPPNANLKVAYEKLQKTVKLSCKKAPIMQTIVGNEEASDADLVENIKYILNNIEHHMPQGIHNMKNAYVKFSMGKPVKVM
ncbi:MAG: 50S ribosomal protein L1 [Candidatus Woesearchaeota archaeon]|nr:50S ribosomal protein L1 [Candidatus Woesearchaeota archaeon]